MARLWKIERLLCWGVLRLGGGGADRILLREIVSVVDSSPYFLSHNFTLPIFSARYVCNAVNETNVSALQSLQ